MQYRVHCEVDIYVDAESRQIAQEATRSVFLDDVLLFFRKGITKSGRMFSIKGLSGSLVDVSILTHGKTTDGGKQK